MQDLSLTARVFTPLQVVIATFFGTLLAGFVCLALNYHRLGEERLYRFSMAAAAVFVPLYIWVYTILPSTTYDRLWPLATALITGLLAQVLQGRIIQQQIEQNTTMRVSPWSLVAVILFSLIMMLIILGLAALLFGFELPV
jgi:hypothetical protein